MLDKTQKFCLLLLRISLFTSLLDLLLLSVFPGATMYLISVPYMINLGIAIAVMEHALLGAGIVLGVLVLLFLTVRAVKKEKLLFPVIFSLFSVINSICGICFMATDTSTYWWIAIGSNVYSLILSALLCRYCRDGLLGKNASLSADTPQAGRLCVAAKVYEWATRIILAAIPVYVLIMLLV